VSALSAAQTHLTKAREFLEAAEWNLEGELYNAAASNAVTSGINCKDAICLVLTGRSAKSDQHTAAVAELRAALGVNAVGAVQGPTPPTALGRLLRMKSKSQYQAADVSPSDAARAVGWARKLLDAATLIVAD
jgi:hypothetical protein